MAETSARRAARKAPPAPRTRAARETTAPPFAAAPPEAGLSAALLGVASDALLALDRTGQVVWANRAAARLFQYDPQTLVGVALDRLIPARANRGAPAGGAWQRRAVGAGPFETIARTRQGAGIQVRVCLEESRSDGAPHFVAAIRDMRPQKLIEDKYRALRSHFRRVIETAAEAVISADMRGRITLFNASAEKIFGYARAEVLRRPIDILIPSRFRARHHEHVADFAAAAANTRMMGERGRIVGLRRDGTEFPAEASISRFLVRGQSIFNIVLRDATAAEQAAEVIRARERLFRAVFEQTFQFTAVLDVNGTIREINQGALALAHSSQSDLVGMRFWDVKWSRSRSMRLRGEFRQDVERAAQGAFVRRMTQTVDADGQPKTIDFSVKPVRDESGRIVMLIAEGRDISQHLEAEDALRRSETLLSRAEKLARIGSWEWDIATRAICGSEEFYRILGIPRSNPADEFDAFIHTVHPDDRERVRAALRGTICGQAQSLEFRLRRPDGTEGTLHALSKPLQIVCGRTVRAVGFVQDVTDRKAIEERLRDAKIEAEQAALAKTTFLANMSHELRTPLNAIIGFSDLISKEAFGPLAPERYRGYVSDIHDSGRHLLDIINNILDMSKIEAGRQELVEADVDLTRMVDSCLRIAMGMSNSRNLSISRSASCDDHVVRADELMVRKIVLNLLSNAIKFTRPGGTVTVSTRTTPEGGVALAVADSGIGIAARDIPKVLEPFGQVDTTLGRQYNGTGLGLPLAKSLVELHGGSLAIDSQPGNGTTVTAFFPPERARAAAHTRRPLQPA